MAVKLENLSKWTRLPVGKPLALDGKQDRWIRLHVNCAVPTHFTAVPFTEDSEEPGDPVFLAVVQGRETIEFVASGYVEIIVTGEDDIFYFTPDGDQIAVEFEDARSFTKIASRRARNPELEYLMYKQQQNIERRMTAMQSDYAAQIAAMGTRYNVDTGEVDDDDDTGANGETGGAKQQAPASAAEPAAAGQVASPAPAAAPAAAPAPAK